MKVYHVISVLANLVGAQTYRRLNPEYCVTTKVRLLV